MTDYGNKYRGRDGNELKDRPNVFFIIVLAFAIFALLMVGVAR